MSGDCDPSNPIAGGACPIVNTGPPNVVLPLSGAIKTPEQKGSSPAGTYKAIGQNIEAIGYYIDSLGVGKDFKGYGIRQIYNTGIKCSNIPGTAHRLADGTASSMRGYGLVPRMLGAVGGLIPGDLVSSATDSTRCQSLLVHENTPEEQRRLRDASGNIESVVPPSNKISITTPSGKVDYTKMDELCRQRMLEPCRSVPVRFEDVQMEGFENLKMYDNSRPYILLGAILILGVGALIIKENL